MRIPAEAFHISEFLLEEMDARGWTSADVAVRMGPLEEAPVNLLALDLLLTVHDKNLLVGDEMFRGLAKAFCVSEQFFRNLDASWRDHPSAQ